MQLPREDRGDEEEDDVDDAEDPRNLEHGAGFLDLEAPVVAAAVVVVAELHADGYGPRDAVPVLDEVHQDDAGDEAGEEDDVDDEDEEGVNVRAVELEEGEEAPGAGDDGDNEHQEQPCGRRLVGLDVRMHKVSEHAHHREQQEDLEDPHEGEDYA